MISHSAPNANPFIFKSLYLGPNQPQVSSDDRICACKGGSFFLRDGPSGSPRPEDMLALPGSGLAPGAMILLWDHIPRSQSVHPGLGT